MTPTAPIVTTDLKIVDAFLVLYIVFGSIIVILSSTTMAQKDAEPGLSADTQRKLGIKLHKVVRWDKTRSGLS
jgi:hypothetical protein